MLYKSTKNVYNCLIEFAEWATINTTFICNNGRSSINSKNLAGACALGSFILHNILNANKIKNTLCVGNFIKDDRKISHCWIKVKDYILDPTFSQFSEISNILITNDKNIKLLYRCDVENIKAIDQMMNWMGSQNPFLYKIDYTKMIIRY